MKKFVSGFDMFGHDIKLNFKGNDSINKTVIGGVFSIMIKFLLASYVMLNFKYMIFHDDDNIKQYTTYLDLNEEPAILYNESNNLIIWNLKKTKTGNKPLFINDNPN